MTDHSDFINVLTVTSFAMGLYCIGHWVLRIKYLIDDDNFKEGAHWPKWLIQETKKWNKNNPDKQVKIRQ